MKRVALLLAGPVLALGCGVLFPGLADAQDGDATLAVDAVHPAGSSVHYIVTLAQGGEPVEGATVTATATGPDGTAGDPVPLEATDPAGTYSGAVAMETDGTWTVTFTSTGPDATLEYTQEVPASTVEDAAGESAGEDEDDDGISNPGVLVFGGLFLVAVLGIVAWGLLGRKPAAEAAEPEPEPESSTTSPE